MTGLASTRNVLAIRYGLAGTGRHGGHTERLAQARESERLKARLGEMWAAVLWPGGGRGHEPDYLAQQWQAPETGSGKHPGYGQ